MARTRPDPKTELAFRNYVQAAANARDDIEFFLENCEGNFTVDYSLDSLLEIEKFYRAAIAGSAKFPTELGTPQEFIELACLYLGETIIRAVNGKWVLICDNGTRMLPAVTFDGCPNWAVCYPSRLAASFQNLHNTNPNFAGLRKREVLAEQLRSILSVHKKHA
ncbi:MAG: hypothetical protein IPK27_07390 [Rhodanobacteraceae bacterium]|nr:hypothetical protein [Rhodanobacteraceae bacterium]